MWICGMCDSGFGEDNEAVGFWVLPRSGCRYNTVNWIRQGEEENILEVGPRSRKVSDRLWIGSCG